MPKLKYIGRADKRRFLKSDFTGVDVDDQDAVHFDAKNDFTAEVSESAAKFLTENPTTKRDFKLIEDEATDTDKEAAASDSDGSTGTADAAAPSTAKSRKRTT